MAIPDGIDPDVVYGTNKQSLERKEKLRMEMLRKALDMPVEDDMQVSANKTYNVSNSNSGNGWLKGAIVGAGLLAGGATAGLGLHSYLKPAAPQSTLPAAPSTQPAQGWDALTEELQPDGTWKTIRRDHLK